jgi:hypothetical protein
MTPDHLLEEDGRASRSGRDSLRRDHTEGKP